MDTGMREVRITGKRIVLRQIEYADTAYIVAWRNKERVRSRFIYRETFTQKGHENWMRTMVESGKAVQLMICEKGAGDAACGNEALRPVGSVYFRDIDRDKKEAEYGIFLGEDDAVGKGYGTETAKLAVDYAFGELGLEKLVLRVFTDNHAAVGSYERAGFVKESLLEAVECSDGEKKDMFFMVRKKQKEKGTEQEAQKRTKVSFVIPCYRSELTLPKVVDEIRTTMDRLWKEGNAYDYEVVLVNDCSPDDTFGIIKKLAAEDTRIKGINLARNFGQHAALMAGFHYVDGDIVVCLDDDGQTPADEAGKLLAGIEQGSDVVYAKYEHKKHSLFRNFGSLLNEEMAKVMLGKPKDLYVSSYFAARRFVVEEMKRYTNAFPYVIGLALRTTKRISNVTVTHREREIGTSGYTFGKLLGLWFNGFTAFSVKPLRIATAIGCTCSAAGFLYGIYTVVKKFINPDVPLGFSSLMAAIVFMGGMTMVMLGLVGEYIGRMYISMNSSPQYVVRETVNEGGQEDGK